MQQYDVVIVGGGNVGLALACSLAKQTSLSILLLEASDKTPSWDAGSYHHRVSAISLSSMRILQSLGVWKDVVAKRVSPFEQIAVWDNWSSLSFSCQEIAEPALGFIIENNAIQRALYDKLKTYEQITYQAGVKLASYQVDGNGASLITESGETIRARLFVAADGGRSWLRQQAGIACQQQDYQQSAIVATVQTAQPHEKVARQVFLPTGPLAFLPLAEANLCSIVWSLPTDVAANYAQLDEAVFSSKLAIAFAGKLGDIEKISERFQFPLIQQQAARYISNRLALVGDAAHTVHPLAGQGVNMGLLDAASLADVVIRTIRSDRDIGGQAALRQYERWRKGDNALMYRGIDAIKKLYASDNDWMREFKNTGLLLTDQTTWLKNMFIRQAVGNRQGLPSLAICMGQQQ